MRNAVNDTVRYRHGNAIFCDGISSQFISNKTQNVIHFITSYSMRESITFPSNVQNYGTHLYTFPVLVKHASRYSYRVIYICI